ncbi:Acylphosphatase [Laetiporus sulphureus 93-53]|uniref:Acylphosphatase n=1 Tax=Laetiporus sulphureus 93-53 TaxID=1314785 RepID=A0A165D136_9APHY|nr:Acylphosphatase [Laetiporus sulphureus 93-53]KZT03927.1 Acylphosphatase [Laetiporus sulphureus 93-53]
MPYLSFKFTVRGRVQGVYFRAFSKGVAHDVGVVGWVANDTNGQVVGEAQGGESAIDRFKRALYTGPPYARVDAVDIADERVIDELEYNAFESSKMARKPQLSIYDYLHRGVVYSLLGLTIWGVVTMGLVHRNTMQKGKEALALKEASVQQEQEQEDEENEIALAQAAQSVLTRGSKS